MEVGSFFGGSPVQEEMYQLALFSFVHSQCGVDMFIATIDL